VENISKPLQHAATHYANIITSAKRMLLDGHRSCNGMNTNDAAQFVLCLKKVTCSILNMESLLTAWATSARILKLPNYIRLHWIM